MKKFFVVTDDPKSVPQFTIVEAVDADLAEVRGAIQSNAYDDGSYVIAEVVDRVTISTIKTEPIRKVTFAPTRKRPRKDKAAGASQKAAK